MQAGVGLLVSDVMPIYMSYLDTLITMLNSVNCSTVICSPTVEILMLLREATSETYGPRVYSHHINLQTLYYCFAFLLCLLFYFASLYQKIPKILSIISIRSHSRK